MYLHLTNCSNKMAKLDAALYNLVFLLIGLACTEFELANLSVQCAAKLNYCCFKFQLQIELCTYIHLYHLIGLDNYSKPFVEINFACNFARKINYFITKLII